MNVDDESHLGPVLCEERFVSLCFWLGERFFTWEIDGARIAGSILMLTICRVPARLLILNNIVNLAEVDSKVAVQVYALINISGGAAADLREVLASG